MLVAFTGSALMAYGTGVVATLVETHGVHWAWLLLCTCALKVFLCSAFLVLMVRQSRSLTTRIPVAC